MKIVVGFYVFLYYAAQNMLFIFYKWILNWKWWIPRRRLFFQTKNSFVFFVNEIEFETKNKIKYWNFCEWNKFHGMKCRLIRLKLKSKNV